MPVFALLSKISQIIILWWLFVPNEAWTTLLCAIGITADVVLLTTPVDEMGFSVFCNVNVPFFHLQTINDCYFFIRSNTKLKDDMSRTLHISKQCWQMKQVLLQYKPNVGTCVLAHSKWCCSGSKIGTPEEISHMWQQDKFLKHQGTELSCL